jgi:uncharacterized Rmd1/YagE family protein
VQLEPFLEKPLLQVEYDGFDYSYADSTKLSNDEVILENNSAQLKLAISHGMHSTPKIYFPSSSYFVSKQDSHNPSKFRLLKEILNK